MKNEATYKEKEEHCNKYTCVTCPIIKRCSLGLALKYYNPFEDLLNKDNKTNNIKEKK